MNDSHNNNTKKAEGWQVKEPVKVEDFAAPQRIFFDASKLEREIYQKGVRIKLYRTSQCPNVKSIDSAEHNGMCPLCDGSGFIDVLPIETMAYIHDVNLDKVMGPEGYIDRSSTRATFLQGIELQYFTKIELMDYTSIYYQRVKKSDTDTDVLQYAAKRVNFIIDQYGKYFYQAIDFDLDMNGNVRWFINRGPIRNTIYTIHYECNTVYRATKAIHINRFAQIKNETGGISFVKLFEEWELERAYLAERKDINGNVILPNKIY